MPIRECTACSSTSHRDAKRASSNTKPWAAVAIALIVTIGALLVAHHVLSQTGDWAHLFEGNSSVVLSVAAALDALLLGYAMHRFCQSKDNRRKQSHPLRHLQSTPPKSMAQIVVAPRAAVMPSTASFVTVSTKGSSNEVEVSAAKVFIKKRLERLVGMKERDLEEEDRIFYSLWKFLWNYHIEDRREVVFGLPAIIEPRFSTHLARCREKSPLVVELVVCRRASEWGLSPTKDKRHLVSLRKMGLDGQAYRCPILLYFYNADGKMGRYPEVSLSGRAEMQLSVADLIEEHEECAAQQRLPKDEFKNCTPLRETREKLIAARLAQPPPETYDCGVIFNGSRIRDSYRHLYSMGTSMIMTFTATTKIADLRKQVTEQAHTPEALKEWPIFLFVNNKEVMRCDDTQSLWEFAAKNPIPSHASYNIRVDAVYHQNALFS